MTDNTILEAIPVTSDTQAAIDAGKQIGELRTIDQNNSRYVLVPYGFDIKELKYLNGRPDRVDTVVNTSTTESFIAYFKRFANEHSIVIFHSESAKFLGYIDYHEAGTPVVPNFQDHIVMLQVHKTPEWATWQDDDQISKNQEDFSRFIEKMALDIIEPDAATMLEIACSLQATKSVRFKSGIRLSDGQTQISYIEQIDGSAGAEGRLTIPNTIKLGIQLFYGGPRYQMTARFRYRLIESKLKLWYELVRPEKVVEDALREIKEEITTALAPNLIIEG